MIVFVNPIPYMLDAMKILDGKIVRDKIAQKLKEEISRLSLKPKLVIIQVGNLAESNAYIRQKVLFGQKIGAIVDHQKLSENITQKKLIAGILSLNSDSSVHGIIIQMPIPTKLDKDTIIESIDPKKDVDGQTSTNIKKLMENDQTGFTPATTKGILTLLDYYKIHVSGKNITVIGRSSLVGKPTALALLNRDATVTICHSKTKNLSQLTRNADILIVAAGKPKLITASHVSKNQIVIDVGINVPDDSQSSIDNSRSQLVGDVDFESVKSVVAAITPVPGGVGPMTVASLFENLLEAYEKKS